MTRYIRGILSLTGALAALGLASPQLAIGTTYMETAGVCVLPWPPYGTFPFPGELPFDDGCPTAPGDCNASLVVNSFESNPGPHQAVLEWGALPAGGSAPDGTPYGDQIITDGNCTLQLPCTFDIGLGVDINPPGGGRNSEPFVDYWHGSRGSHPTWDTTDDADVVSGGDGSSINYYRIQAEVPCGGEKTEVIQANAPNGDFVALHVDLVCDGCGATCSVCGKQQSESRSSQER